MANDLPLMQYSGSELLDALIPKKPAKTTTTTKKDISAQGTDRLIQQQLQKDANFAAIARQESGAGLYNSTVAEKLANDLAVRNAGEVAAISAPTVTQAVTEPARQSPGAAIGLALASDLFSKAEQGGGLLDTIGGLFGGAGNARTAAADSLVGIGNAAGAVSDTGFGVIGDAIGSIFGNIGGSSGLLGPGGATAGIAGITSGLGSLASAGSGASAAALGGFGEAASGAAGLFGEAGALSGLGNLGGLAPILGPVAIIGGLLSLFGGDMSIICTELHNQGKLTKLQYARGWAKVAKEATLVHRIGYFTFSPRVLARIKKNPDGLECKAWAWFFKRRARNDLIGKALTTAFSKYCEYAGNKVLA